MKMIDNGNKFDFGQTAADYAKYSCLKFIIIILILNIMTFLMWKFPLLVKAGMVV